jgi:predicted nuclease of predicted toxin-antitoxin system
MASTDRPMLFVDRSLGRRSVVDALNNAGYAAIAHDDRFRQDTPDAEWIAEASAHGWIILTKDSAIRRNPLERAAYRDSGSRVFVLTSQNMTGAAMAAAFIAAMPRILARIDDTEPPCVFAVRRNGEVERLE